MDYSRLIGMTTKEVLALLREEQIKYIDILIEQGASDEELIKNPIIDRQILKEYGIPASYLIPERKGMKITEEDWNLHIPRDKNWSLFNGTPFEESGYTIESVMMILLNNIGLEHFIDILPEESRQELKELLCRDKESVF